MDPRIRTYLDLLNTRLLNLRVSLSYRKLSEAGTELKKCQAMKSNIGDLIGSAHLDPIDYFLQLQSVDELVIEISADVERMKNVWWRQAWAMFKSGIQRLFKPVSGLLKSPERQFLLE